MRFKVFLLITSVFLFITCAKKGRPTGGPKDEIAPLLVVANPPYGSTNFKGKNIRIYFDEYVVLKDLQKQLIVSPPFKNAPIITPQGIPSKYINIKFSEELQENTTYTFNFGNAVQDNNEGNKLESFKYVFSTGSMIDSLEFSGKIIDAFNGKLKKNTSVLLYKLDSTFTDSIVYKKKPKYVAITTDSLNFKFSNIKEGKYKIFALQEDANDYIFNSKNDKIGFYEGIISLPQDSVLKKPISIFKETQPFKFKRGREITKGKIQFGYKGKQKDLSVILETKVPASFESVTLLEKNKDTLNYWFTPIEKDSLNFIVKNDTFLDTITVKLRKKKIDSLSVSSSVKGILDVNDTLILKTNNPIFEIDKSKITLIDKDSASVPYTIMKKNATRIDVLFKQKPKNNYIFGVLPNALTDIYKTTNDKLNYNFSTKDIEDYGEINLVLDNKTKHNLILELVENKNVVRTIFVHATSQKVEFKFLIPKKYKIRAIIDVNDNKIWDTGNYLTKTQAERIIYFSKEISLRANWTIDETFLIKN